MISISRIKGWAVVGAASLALLFCAWGLPWLMYVGWELTEVLH